jgi:hypothetical protein
MVTIFETIPDGAEAYEVSASTVEVAADMGRGVAAAWTRRGWETDFLGVIPHSANVEIDMRDGSPRQAVKRDGFRPVLRVKP